MGIFSVAIGLHIFKTGGAKIRVSNSGGGHVPPVIDAYDNRRQQTNTPIIIIMVSIQATFQKRRISSGQTLVVVVQNETIWRNAVTRLEGQNITLQDKNNNK